MQAVSKALEERYDCMVFHATGTGGQSMEKLVESGLLAGVLDITTTEVADEIAGGVLTAGPGRMDVFASRAIPYVGSLGALDMVNFWAMETVPPQYRERKLYRHNSNVTLMRTTAEECRADRPLHRAQAERDAGPGALPRSPRAAFPDWTSRAARSGIPRPTRRFSMYSASEFRATGSKQARSG